MKSLKTKLVTAYIVGIGFVLTPAFLHAQYAVYQYQYASVGYSLQSQTVGNSQYVPVTTAYQQPIGGSLTQPLSLAVAEQPYGAAQQTASVSNAVVTPATPRLPNTGGGGRSKMPSSVGKKPSCFQPLFFIGLHFCIPRT